MEIFKTPELDKAMEIFKTPELDKAIAPYLIIMKNIKLEINTRPGGNNDSK